ncbi:unnamed protein product [Allacma fusca]|uniref:Uncharacterized protein n=1 Tax=Allacma fusca TaxID=39272 RepID=A0A8J2LY55_9HEXA|nr:unnamed protein product [Allacma fusca]
MATSKNSWNWLCVMVAFSALFSVLYVTEAGVAVGLCIKCPANFTNGTAIERDCGASMDPFDVDKSLEDPEMCPDESCYIKVTGAKVERGCVKDFIPEGTDTGPCDPMRLYIDKNGTVPMYCICRQRKHCNDLNNYARNPKDPIKSRKYRNTARSLHFPGFDKLTMILTTALVTFSVRFPGGSALASRSYSLRSQNLHFFCPPQPWNLHPEVSSRTQN